MDEIKNENEKNENQESEKINSNGALENSKTFKSSEDDNKHDDDKHDDDDNNKTLRGLLDFIIALVIAIVAAMVIRTVVFAREDVEGPSMQSTLHNNDVLFVEKISLLTKDYKRGQIVIFDSEDENHDIFIKRVIGLEGDKLEIKNGKVYRNGTELNESYLDPGIRTYGDSFLHENQVYTVPKGCIFVMGDNRTDSTDSRKIGPVNIKNIKGHVIIRAYPFNQMRTF